MGERKKVRIGRTLPPAAAPIPLGNILRACFSTFGAPCNPSITFETELEVFFETKYCFLVSSGKAALTLILTALKNLYPERKEVLIPAFTCYSVPAAIKKAGLIVKLCDMAPCSLDINKDHLQEIISADWQEKKLLCVLVTHLFGCPANFPSIKKIVGSEIPIIEDAAQAMGEELSGKKLGTFGDAGFFSLGRGKALSTMEGGVIITNRDDLGKIIGTLMESLPGYSQIATIKLAIKALLTNMLQKPLMYGLPKALPFLRLGETIYEENFSLNKFSSFQRKLARNWRERLKTHQKARIENIKFWQDRLPNTLLRACREYTNSSMIRLPLLAGSHQERNCLEGLSGQAGLGIMPGYPTLIHKIPEIAHEFSAQQYPHANYICERLFTIPVHELVTDEDKKQIASLLARVVD